jgi:phosphopantothenoylcysteine decarboxylase / phosphopantothenate---cysteine ligase
MWTHAATQRNVARLAADGIAFVGPEDGEMACGEYGPGRMAEPMAIVAAIARELGRAAPTTPGRLTGRHVVVTAGPTHEPIDPVRFIGNRSSGLQGFAIARAAAAAGARVTLISGPVALANPDAVQVVKVGTALQMLAAAEAALPADVFVAAAAVADWRVEEIASQKLKKTKRGAPSLRLAENPDILATIAKSGAARPSLVIGFAAETQNVLENAREKLERKGCDLIVANAVGEGTGVFGGANNEVHIITRDGVSDWPNQTKDAVAQRLIALTADLLDRPR